MSSVSPVGLGRAFRQVTAASIVSPLAFGIVAQLSGNFTLPFVGSVALLLVGAVLAWRFLPRAGAFATAEAALPGVR